MKRALIRWPALLFVVPAAVAEWAMVPLEDLLKQTDVIVVARLTSVVTTTKEAIDYSSGTLVVSEVLRGSAKAGQKLNLEWSNFTGLACPRVENCHHTNRAMIWLLQNSSNASVSADYPGRVLDLERRMELEALLSAPAGSKKQAAHTPKSTPSCGPHAFAIHYRRAFTPETRWLLQSTEHRSTMAGQKPFQHWDWQGVCPPLLLQLLLS